MDPNRHHCIYLVRRAQQAIARDSLLRNLMTYTGRDAFVDAAHSVVENFFPRAVHRGNTSNVDALVEMYSHAFVLAPLQFRVPGVFRVDWGHGTTLSWFRRSIGKNTGQYRWCEPQVSIDRSPESVYRAFTSVVRIRDTDFATTAATILANLAASGGRKADAARLFLDPFAGAEFDQSIDRIFHVRSNAEVRRKHRARGESVGSYLRIGDRTILLADVATSKREESTQYQWKDIRETPIRWQGYVISWDHGESRIRVQLEARVVAAALREIKGILDSAARQHQKLASVIRTAETFMHAHRYATGSLLLLREFNQKVQRLVAKRITANNPSLVYTPRRTEMYDKLVLPISHPFLSPLPARSGGEHPAGYVSDETWMQFWSPYRVTNAWVGSDRAKDAEGAA